MLDLSLILKFFPMSCKAVSGLWAASFRKSVPITLVAALVPLVVGIWLGILIDQHFIKSGQISVVGSNFIGDGIGINNGSVSGVTNLTNQGAISSGNIIVDPHGPAISQDCNAACYVGWIPSPPH
jgi:hypothetical protein